jgi:peroxiredoxin Q/BCP
MATPNAAPADAIARSGLQRDHAQRSNASMATPEVGSKAPDIELVTDSGETFRLSEQKGIPVVLFFYPADNTDGCTIENIEFTDELPDFQKLGAKVIGISPDSVESHCSFRDKFKIKVTLAADPDKKAIAAYDLWGPKVTFGHHHDGLFRTTFLIAPDGTVAGVYPVNRIKGHAATVLEDTRKLVGALT